MINSEFNGRPEAPETAEAMFLKSLDELLPIFEREGLQLIIEPHPDDFIEDGLEALNLIRGLNPGGSASSTAHRTRSTRAIPPQRSSRRPERRCATCTWPTRGTTPTSSGLRYISNPPGNTTRVHQHMEMGRGEVDYDAVFAALAEVGFDGVVSSCVFGWEEDARGVSERQRDKALALIGKHFGGDSQTAVTSSKITSD